MATGEKTYRPIYYPERPSIDAGPEANPDGWYLVTHRGRTLFAYDAIHFPSLNFVVRHLLAPRWFHHLSMGRIELNRHLRRLRRLAADREDVPELAFWRGGKLVGHKRYLRTVETFGTEEDIDDFDPEPEPAEECRSGSPGLFRNRPHRLDTSRPAERSKHLPPDILPRIEFAARTVAVMHWIAAGSPIEGHRDSIPEMVADDAIFCLSDEGPIGADGITALILRSLLGSVVALNRDPGGEFLASVLRYVLIIAADEMSRPTPGTRSDRAGSEVLSRAIEPIVKHRGRMKATEQDALHRR